MFPYQHKGSDTGNRHYDGDHNNKSDDQGHDCFIISFRETKQDYELTPLDDKIHASQGMNRCLAHMERGQG